MDEFCSIQIQLLTGTSLGNRPDIQQLLTPGTYTPPPDTSFVTLYCSLNPSGDIWAHQCAQKPPIGSSDVVRARTYPWVSSQHGTWQDYFALLKFHIFLWYILSSSTAFGRQDTGGLLLWHALQNLWHICGRYSFGVSIRISRSVVYFARSQLRSEAYQDPPTDSAGLGRGPSHSMPLPKPCLTKLISEHRHPFCKPEHPGVTGNAPTWHIHTPAQHGDPLQRVAFPHWDGQHVCTSLDCFQPPTGRIAHILDTPHFPGVSTNFELK